MLTLGDTTGECFSLLRLAVCIVQVVRCNDAFEQGVHEGEARVIPSLGEVEWESDGGANYYISFFAYTFHLGSSYIMCPLS